MKVLSLDSQFFYLLTICLLVIVCSLLFFKVKIKEQWVATLLLLYFISYLYLISITYIFVYYGTPKLAHTLRTGHIATLIMPPISYYYTAKLVNQKKWHFLDVFHFIPLLLYVIDMSPFFTLSASEKWSIFSKMDAVEYRLGFSQGFFMPKYGHILIRILLVLTYWIAQLKIIINVKRQKEKLSNNLVAKYAYKWLFIFLFAQALIFIIPFLGMLLKNAQLETVLFSFATCVSMSVQCFYLLLHPELLSVQSLFQPYSEPTPNSAVNFSIPAENNSELLLDKTSAAKQPQGEIIINAQELAIIEEKIAEVMNTKQPYLKGKYFLHQLSIDTNISSNKLSYYINKKHSTNFSEFLNRYRIALFIEKVKNGEHNFKTLEAIAFDCGFESRITFIRAFKKEKGITPSGFLNTFKGA